MPNHSDAYNPIADTLDPDAPSVFPADPAALPSKVRNCQTEQSLWRHGTAGRHGVRLLKPVADPDEKPVGVVREIHDQYLLVSWRGQPDLEVPYEAVQDVTDDRVLLAVPVDRLRRVPPS